MATLVLNSNADKPSRYQESKPLNPFAEPFNYQKPRLLPFPPPPPPPPPPVMGWPATQKISIYHPRVFVQYCAVRKPRVLGQEFHQNPPLLCKDGGVCGSGKAVKVKANKRKVARKAKRSRPSLVGRLREGEPNYNQSVWVPKNSNSNPKESVKVGSILGSPVHKALKSGGIHTSPAIIHGQEPFSLDGKTTVMIRNIPNKVSKANLLEVLDNFCQEENQNDSNQAMIGFDFVYLPMDFKQRCNLGYAFVNFTSSDAAIRVSRFMHKGKWMAYESRKICEICCAKIQGKEALVKNFQSSNFTCHTEEYMPVVFSPPRNGSNPCTATIVGYFAGSKP